VLVVGGQSTGAVILASAELYDPATGSWTATGSLATSRYQHTATLLPNGKVLVAAASRRRPCAGQCRLYDPATGSWTTTGPLTAARGTHTATLLSNAACWLQVASGTAHLSVQLGTV